MSLHHGLTYRLTLFVALACAALSSGCDTLGNGRALAGSPQAMKGIAVIGRSTRDDVLRDLGEANVYRFANGAESWTCRETHGLPRFVQFLPYLSYATLLIPPKVTEVAFLFDAQGVLIRIDRRE